jgi:hypothetical protein
MHTPESLSSNEEVPILKVIVSRHGPKASASGEKDKVAPYFEESVSAGFQNMNIDSEKSGLVHVATSEIKRAKDTADIYNEKVKETLHRTPDRVLPSESLGVPLQVSGAENDPRFAADLSTIISMQQELEPGVRKEIEEKFPQLDQIEKEAEVRNELDIKVCSVFFNDKEHEFQVSYEEFADRIAERYKGFFNNIHILEGFKKDGVQPEGEPYIQIDVTHSFLVMSFLKKYLVFSDGVKALDLTPEEFFERTGGIIRESQSFEMDFINGDERLIKIKAEFEKGKSFEGVINL